MKFKLYVFLIVVFAVFFFSVPKALADNITLDGEFDDWNDKPYIEDHSEDEDIEKDIVMVRWFSDFNDMNLYLYCERLAGYNENDINGNRKNPHAEDWELKVKVNVRGDGGRRRADVSYHPESRRVRINLFDGSGNYLWSAHGKWGDDKYTGERIEFFIPLYYLVESAPGGYEFDIIFVSSSDRTPDSGAVTVSTISSFPKYTAVILVLLVLGGYGFLIRKGAKND